MFLWKALTSPTTTAIDPSMVCPESTPCVVLLIVARSLQRPGFFVGFVLTGVDLQGCEPLSMHMGEVVSNPQDMI